MWTQSAIQTVALNKQATTQTVKEARRTIKLLNRQDKTVAFQWISLHIRIQSNATANLLAKKGNTLQNKQTPLNFETIKTPTKQKTQEKFYQETTALFNTTQWQNIKITLENSKNKPRKQAFANFQLNTGHDCLAAHLHRTKIFSYNYCTMCKLKNTLMDKDHLLVCPKLDHTSKVT